MTITATLVKELRERTGAGMMECKQALVESKGNIEHAIEFMRKSGQIKAAKRAGKVATDGTILALTTPDFKQAVLLEINSETDFVANDSYFKSFAQKVGAGALLHRQANPEQLNQLPIEEKREQTIEQARQELIIRVGENIQIRRGVFLEVSGSNEAIYSYSHGKKIGVLVHMQGGSQELGTDIAMHIAASHPEVLHPQEVPPARLAKEKEILRAQSEKEGKPAAIIEKMLEGRIKKFVDEISLYRQEFVKDPSQTIAKILENAHAKVLQFVRYELGENPPVLPLSKGGQGGFG